MNKLETREQAEARALELWPIHPEFDVDRLKPLREAYLQGWEDAQQDKHTCGFCVEPKQHQKELLKEMMRKDEASGMYDDINEIEEKFDLMTLSGQHLDRMSKELEETGSVPTWWKGVATISITAIEDFQNTIQDNKLREAAEKIVLMIERDIAELENPNNSIGGMCTVRGKLATIKGYKDELEKALR